jgi:bifunctional non-homologous end joining protein LigD
LKNLRFDSLKAILARLPVKNAILDGEIICIDGKGVSQFNQLLSRRAEPIFYPFDLLWLNDEDLRGFPLNTRKQRLKNLLQSTGHSHIMYAQHVETQGRLFFDEICTRDLEGIVAKPKLSIYKDGGNSWLKIKNRNYSQAEADMSCSRSVKRDPSGEETQLDLEGSARQCRPCKDGKASARRMPD